MTDTKKKLEALRSQLGLVTGKDIVSGGSSPSPRVSAAAKKPTPPGSISTLRTAGGLLSDAMAAQLSARLGVAGANASAGNASTTDAMAIDVLLPGKIEGDENYGFFLLQRAFPLHHALGEAPLGAALSCAGRLIALSACDDALLAFDPRSTCYMDTETTGLAGGAGTIAFLVGLGYFEGESFLLEQCFLRDYDDEGAMLEYLGRVLPRFTAVVSYNGKSFDMPLLRSRFIQHRLDFPLTQAAHFDLVHAARRVWKKRLSDCSLGNIEREVLGLRRQSDIPGPLIPQTWLDYLDFRDARPLLPVFRHHELDILSLAALTGHLAQRLADDTGPAFHHAEDQLSVAKLYFRNKDYSAAMSVVQQLLEASRVVDDLRREGLALLARSAKKANQFEAMREAWQTLHEEYPGDIEAAEELAKVHEHQCRNLKAAIQVCRETMACLDKEKEGRVLLSDFGFSGLRGRLKRLEAKYDRLMKKRQSEDSDFLTEEDIADE